MSDQILTPAEGDPDGGALWANPPDHELEVLEDDPSVPPRPEEEIADAAEVPEPGRSLDEIADEADADSP
ncbi:MAG TPA: hypothetical protein VFJ97_02690 [Dermatophilaceae bacterium]|nr:hypothetical protein [Dermatophilaceae bacterium]